MLPTFFDGSLQLEGDSYERTPVRLVEASVDQHEVMLRARVAHEQRLVQLRVEEGRQGHLERAGGVAQVGETQRPYACLGARECFGLDGDQLGESILGHAAGLAQRAEAAPDGGDQVGVMGARHVAHAERDWDPTHTE